MLRLPSPSRARKKPPAVLSTAPRKVILTPPFTRSAPEASMLYLLSVPHQHVSESLRTIYSSQSPESTVDVEPPQSPLDVVTTFSPSVTSSVSLSFSFFFFSLVAVDRVTVDVDKTSATPASSPPLTHTTT